MSKAKKKKEGTKSYLPPFAVHRFLLCSSCSKPSTQLFDDRIDCNTLLTKHVFPMFTKPFNTKPKIMMNFDCSW